MKPWIGVDLDGTLAQYDEWLGPDHIGEPVPAMLERVKTWLDEGHEVRIMTARVSAFSEDSFGQAMISEQAIQKWCEKHLGRVLKITCCKDYEMIELWDDRCVAVEQNTGRALNDSRRNLG